ncbi:hypothetical protein EMIT0215P_130101 [Pseudomonas serboccidentalis]
MPEEKIRSKDRSLRQLLQGDFDTVGAAAGCDLFGATGMLGICSLRRRIAGRLPILLRRSF